MRLQMNETEGEWPQMGLQSAPRDTHLSAVKETTVGVSFLDSSLLAMTGNKSPSLVATTLVAEPQSMATTRSVMTTTCTLLPARPSRGQSPAGGSGGFVCGKVVLPHQACPTCAFVGMDGDGAINYSSQSGRRKVSDDWTSVNHHQSCSQQSACEALRTRGPTSKSSAIQLPRVNTCRSVGRASILRG